VESIGREKVSLKSGVQELNKLEIKSESGTWQIWLNDQWMVMKMSVVGENTEVVRD
jgi:plasmid maintenance system killer protein